MCMENANMKKRSESIWTYRKMINVAKKYGVKEVYLCRRCGADALAYFGKEYLFVEKGSIFAPVNDKFNAVKNFVQDYRRISIKAKHEANGVAKIHVAFSTLDEAARFVSASQSARARDWKRILVEV